MRTLRLAVAGVVVLLGLGTTVAFAQTDAEVRGTILQRTNIGDRITVTTRDGARMRGRLVAATDALVVEHDSDRRTFTFTDIDRVSRSKNGVLLGAIIGTAAGVAVGLPVRTYLNNETGDGDQALWVFVAIGAATGIGLDALMASERTVYSRPNSRQSTFAVTPVKGGVRARLSMNW
jgi:hypothetical protein